MRTQHSRETGATTVIPPSGLNTCLRTCRFPLGVWMSFIWNHGVSELTDVAGTAVRNNPLTTLLALAAGVKGQCREESVRVWSWHWRSCCAESSELELLFTVCLEWMWSSFSLTVCNLFAGWPFLLFPHLWCSQPRRGTLDLPEPPAFLVALLSHGLGPWMRSVKVLFLMRRCGRLSNLSGETALQQTLLQHVSVLKAFPPSGLLWWCGFSLSTPLGKSQPGAPEASHLPACVHSLLILPSLIASCPSSVSYGGSATFSLGQVERKGCSQAQKVSNLHFCPTDLKHQTFKNESFDTQHFELRANQVQKLRIKMLPAFYCPRNSPLVPFTSFFLFFFYPFMSDEFRLAIWTNRGRHRAPASSVGFM